MDLNLIKESIETKVYSIKADTKVPLHKHKDKDEVFYCIKGEGVAVSDMGETALTVGETFVARAGTMHSVKSDDEMVLVATLIPVV